MPVLKPPPRRPFVLAVNIAADKKKHAQEARKLPPVQSDLFAEADELDPLGSTARVMERRPLERNTEAAVVNWWKRKGGLQRKMNGEGNRAWPDQLFCTPKTPTFIEFKRLNEKPTQAQAAKLEELLKLGYNTAWFDNPDAAKNYLSRLMGWHK